jgi:hypothetical protein
LTFEDFAQTDIQSWPNGASGYASSASRPSSNVAGADAVPELEGLVRTHPLHEGSESADRRAVPLRAAGRGDAPHLAARAWLDEQYGQPPG